MIAQADAELLEAMATRWSAAAADWDPGTLASLYSADALLFGGREGHAVGREAIEAYFISYRGVILSAALELVEQQILVVDDRCFFAQGHAEFAFTLAGGNRTRSRLRTSLLIVRDCGGLVRAHHFSPAPQAPPLGKG